MPMTPAEKMKRYRERLKNDPEKMEAQRLKNIQRIKLKTKKIAELCEEEKLKKRKIWREQKRNQKEKKRAALPNDTIKENATFPSQKNQQRKKQNTRRNNNMRKKLQASQEKNINLMKTIATLRKKLYRKTKDYENLQHEVLKMKAREEIMEKSLRAAYRNCTSNKQKHVFKKIATTDVVKRNRVKTYMAKLMGLSGRIRSKKKKKVYRAINSEMEKFFLREDISRSTAGKKECRTYKKQKRQIHYLVDTLRNLYIKYKNEGGHLSLSTFCKYKPFYVLSPTAYNRNTCLCIKHANMAFKLAALKKNNMFHDHSMKDILQKVACDVMSYVCMDGKCIGCASIRLDYTLNEVEKDITTTWLQWERVDHEYEKKTETGNKTVKTKKTVKGIKTGTIRQLIAAFEKDLKIFKRHHFIMSHQQASYRECIDGLLENECLILCDFSENYECKLESEVQSMHFGASKTQISLHTGMIYWQNNSQSFCTISPSNNHQPAGIWAHLSPVLKLVKEKAPNTRIIHFFSDGPTSQYRQKKNFFLLNTYTSKLGFEYCTWSFSESGHGKGVADGIGGAVKRALDRQIAYGKDITNATEAYEILQTCMKSVKCFYVPESEINDVNGIIPRNLPTISGTLKIHQISTLQTLVNEYRSLSCFCGEKRGLCSCFSPRKHEYLQENKHEQRHYISPEMTNDHSYVKIKPVNEQFSQDDDRPLTAIDYSMTEDINLDLLIFPSEMVPSSDTTNISEVQVNEEVLIDSTNDIGDTRDGVLSIFDEFGDHVRFSSDDVHSQLDESKINLGQVDTLSVIEKENVPHTDDHPVIIDLTSSNVETRKRLYSPRFTSSSSGCSTSKCPKTQNKNYFICNKCNEPESSISNAKARCMVCKKLYCIGCAGTTFFDYICDACLEG